MRPRKRKIAVVITVWLIVIVLAACVISAGMTYFSLSGRSEKQTTALVRQNVEDVSNDIDEMADLTLITYVDQFVDGDYIATANIEEPDALSRKLGDYYGGSGVEINIVDSAGIIVASSVPGYIGFDMHSGDQSAEFLVLLDGETRQFVQDVKGVSYDETVLMKYAGRRFSDGSGFIQVGLTNDMYYEAIREQARFAATNRRIGENGYLLVCDRDMAVMNSFHNEHTGKNLSSSGIGIDASDECSYVSMEADVFGTPSYVVVNYVKGVYIIGVYPVSEAIAGINTMMNTTVLLELIVFSILFAVLVVLIRLLIVRNIVKVNSVLAEITEGNLEEKVEVRDTYEFDTLSDDINATVDRLKGYIEEAAARIDADLAVAKAIQSSALPNVFPPFPEHKEFELFASMSAAKEVGGDFYDFYMLGERTLGFLIADVSGKSIPGAMFMMTAKAVIKSLAESGLPPAEVFTLANEKLCEGNEAEMFVTAWLGYLDLDTGLVRVANAGHNPPLLIKDGEAGYVMLRPGLMLAGMDGIQYKEQSVQLGKGDILFLYTDGVTEAMDVNEEQYGEERLRKLLSFGESSPVPSEKNGIAEPVCDMVIADVAGFTEGAEQSDDITMLCIRYLGGE
ncbi:MAG: SpoIIE family protein phosphatase [Ruminiclostridium sp.]|nr:SpoIIE family protein phosphatase [Ruminiclostridium sp.]